MKFTIQTLLTLILPLFLSSISQAYTLICATDINYQEQFFSITDNSGTVTKLEFSFDEQCSINDKSRIDYELYYGQYIKARMSCKNSSHFLYARRQRGSSLMSGYLCDEVRNTECLEIYCKEKFE